MNSRLRRLVPSRRVPAVAAMAPLNSLLTSRLLVMGIGAAGPGQGLPSALHLDRISAST